MRTDVESLDEFDAHLGGTGSLAGVVVQSVDLTRRSAVLREADVGGAIFLAYLVPPSILFIPLATIVQAYDPPSSSSTDVYAHIKNNLESWIEAAIAIRAKY